MVGGHVPEAVVRQAGHRPLIGHNPPDSLRVVQAAEHLQDNLSTCTVRSKFIVLSFLNITIVLFIT